MYWHKHINPMMLPSLFYYQCTYKIPCSLVHVVKYMHWSKYTCTESCYTVCVIIVKITDFIQCFGSLNVITRLDGGMLSWPWATTRCVTWLRTSLEKRKLFAFKKYVHTCILSENHRKWLYFCIKSGWKSCVRILLIRYRTGCVFLIDCMVK